MQTADLLESPVKAFEKVGGFLFKAALIVSAVVVGGILSSILLLIPFFSYWDVPTTWKWVPGAGIGLLVALLEIRERRHVRLLAALAFVLAAAAFGLHWYGINHPQFAFDWPYWQTLSLLVIALIYLSLPIVLTFLLGLIGVEEIMHLFFNRKKGAKSHH